MTKTFSTAFTIFILTGLMLVSACGGGPEAETEAARVTRLMTNGKWILNDAKVDGVDQTTVYSGFSLTLTSTGFTTTNGGAVWPASGTWTLEDGAKGFTRSDGEQITINQVSETALVIVFTNNKTTFGPGRSSSIGGVHTFTMKH